MRMKKNQIKAPRAPMAIVTRKKGKERRRVAHEALERKHPAPKQKRRNLRRALRRALRLARQRAGLAGDVDITGLTGLNLSLYTYGVWGGVLMC